MSASVRLFFAASLAALVVAAALNVPALHSGGRSLNAFVHLALFGWATGVIIAVRYHSVPAITGRDFPYPSLLGAHAGLFATGVLLATSGLLAPWPSAYLAGLVLQLAASLVFVANVSWLVRRGPPRAPAASAAPSPGAVLCRLDAVSGVATSVAGLCLIGALLMLLAVRMRWLSGSWYLGAIHTATLGWVTLMIIGVAYRLLPRLSGRATRGAVWVRVQLLGFGLALTVMVLCLGLASSRGFALGAAGMLAALTLFAWAVWPTLQPIRERSVAASPSRDEPSGGGDLRGSSERQS